MTPSGFDALRLSQLRAVATAFLRIRPLVVGPALPCVVLALLFSGAPATQIWVLGGLFSVVLTGFVFEANLARRTELDQRWLLVSLTLTLLAVSTVCALSGGIRSPMLPIVFAPVVTLFAAFGRGSESRLTFALAIGLGALLAALPKLAAFPPIPEPASRVITLAALGVALALLYRSVSGLTDAYRRSAEELDQTRRDALESSAERMRSLEALAGRLAHELKNPLAAIKALAQLLARSEDSTRSPERLAVVIAEIERMERHLEQHLSFSRPLAELRRAPVALDELVEATLGLFEGRASDAGVTLRRAGSATQVRGDRGKLRDALVNLVSNALDATPRGGSVELQVARADTHATIEIIDTGRGMTKEVLERLGTPFFTTREAGSGLGFVIARGVVEQHGGSLTIDSQPARGTRVKMSLPLDGD